VFVVHVPQQKAHRHTSYAFHWGTRYILRSTTRIL
jgi:hypothetical protein